MIDRVCLIEECSKKHKGHGLCDTHLKRKRKGLDLKKQYRNPNGFFVECSIDNCKEKSQCKNMCNTHYQRIRKYDNPDTVLHLQARGKLSYKDVHVTYRGAHSRVERNRGKAKESLCEWNSCELYAKEWAYDHNDKNSVTDIIKGRIQEYSLLPEHYIALCKKHHEDFDMQHRKSLKIKL